MCPLARNKAFLLHPHPCCLLPSLPPGVLWVRLHHSPATPRGHCLIYLQSKPTLSGTKNCLKTALHPTTKYKLDYWFLQKEISCLHMQRHLRAAAAQSGTSKPVGGITVPCRTTHSHFLSLLPFLHKNYCKDVLAEAPAPKHHECFV